MRPKRIFLLLHPGFLICLFLLIANDHWWKHAFSNWLTGKLSDFAGVFVLAVFLIAILPFRKTAIMIATALIFTWWKSPFSEPVIHLFHNLFNIRLARVVDYSDLVALPILIFAYFLKPCTYNLPPRLYLAGNRFIAAVSVLAMTATSLPRAHDYHYPPGRVSVNKTFRTKLTEEAFLHKLDSLQIHWEEQPYEYLPVNPYYYHLKVKSSIDSAEKWIPLGGMQDTALYFRKSLSHIYLIPQLVLEKDTITNLQFRIWDQGRKRLIEVVSMYLPNDFEYVYYTNRKVRKKYLAIVRSLLLE